MSDRLGGALVEDRAGPTERAEERPAPRAGARRPLRMRFNRDRTNRRLLALCDVAGLLLALALALLIQGSRTDGAELMAYVIATLPVWVLICKLYGLYDRDAKRISHSAVDDLPRLFHALLVGLLLLWAYSKVLPVKQLILGELAPLGVAALALIGSMRSVARGGVRRWMGPEKLLLVGTEPVAAALVHRVFQHPEHGLQPMGLLTGEALKGADGEANNGAAMPRLPGSIPLLGRAEDLEMISRRFSPDRVVICRSDFEASQVMEMVDICRRQSIKLSILPDQLESLGPSVEIDAVEGVVLLGLNQPALSRTSRMVKRGFDLSVAVLLLPILTPLMALIAGLIRLDSPGGALFRQPRVGKGGRHFELVKFRTMCDGAEQERAKLMANSRDPRWLDLAHDPRITRIGSFLRKCSLDELPQLWNVLLGEMSLVGPRPLPEEEDAQVGGWGRGRLDLTPGVTGLWQVLGRTRIPFDEMVKLDYLYVTNWSLWMDVKLLLQTFPAVARRRGAN